MQKREAMRWLQLTYKVPSEPSQKRVWVWRRLQNLGAYALQNSVYLLPFSAEVEKHFRQLAQEIHEMGGEASLFAVTALDSADEQRILQILLDARNNEYNTVIKLGGRFLVKAAGLLETSRWSDGERTELTEALERIHVLFRSAKRHDMLEMLTATERAEAAEALAVCEQVFRVLLDKEFAKVRRLLDVNANLFREMDEVATQNQGVAHLNGHDVRHDGTSEKSEPSH